MTNTENRWKPGDVVQTSPTSAYYKVEWAKGRDVLITRLNHPHGPELVKWDQITEVRPYVHRFAEFLRSNMGRQEMHTLARDVLCWLERHPPEMVREAFEAGHAAALTVAAPGQLVTGDCAVPVDVKYKRWLETRNDQPTR